MPARGGFILSCLLHLAIVGLFFLHLPFLDRPIPEEQPIVVELVNLAPETHATEKTDAPPQPKKPVQVAQNTPPEPPQPKPEPPKPQPPQPPPPPPAPPPPPTPPPPPPPPPAPAPPEPKPAPPQPPPPKPQEKPLPPKPQQPKQQAADNDFDKLLKTLSKRQIADNSPPDPKARPTPPAPQQEASSQPIAPLGPQLTTSEVDLVKEQIEQCWNVPVGARDAGNLTPEFRVSMNPDGTVRGAELMNSDRLSDPFFQAAADSARRALLNANCHGPLKLPPDKYDQWQTFTITFDPKDLT